VRVEHRFVGIDGEEGVMLDTLVQVN
jgi:hypothetical protein